MPAYNGLDVIEAWQQNRLSPRLIVMTAFPDAVLEQRVAALGAHLLAKPFSLAAFSAAVRECMAT
jgi:DNA-binding response OmpR family regulator